VVLASNAEDKLKPLDKLMEIYHQTVGRGAQLVLGLAPDNRGLLPDVDVRRLTEFGAEVKRLYGQGLLRERAFAVSATRIPVLAQRTRVSMSRGCKGAPSLLTAP